MSHDANLTLLELREAAVAARQSLRGLVAAIANQGSSQQSLVGEAECVTDNAHLEAMRKRARCAVEHLRFRTEHAPLPPHALESLRTARAPGVAPRRASNEPGTCEDLTLRLRLCAPSQVLTVAVWVSPKGGMYRLAVVSSPGDVELWESDVFSWHRVAQTCLHLSVCSLASAQFSRDGACLWLAIGSGSRTDATHGSHVGDGEAHAKRPALHTSRLMLLSCGTSGELHVRGTLQFDAIPVCGPVALPSRTDGGVDESCITMALKEHQKHHVGLDGAWSGPPADNCAQRFFVVTWAWRSGPSDGASRQQGDAFINGELVELSSFEPIPSSMAVGGVALDSSDCVRGRVENLWALPLGEHGTEVRRPRETCGHPWRLALWICGFGQGSELRLYGIQGECLALLPLGPSVRWLVLPTQGLCPAEAVQRLGISFNPPPFLVLVGQCPAQASAASDWILSVVCTADADGGGNAPPSTVTLQLRHIRAMPVMASCAKILACSDALVCVRAADSRSYVLDWHAQRAHCLPEGWEPVAAETSLLVLLGPSCICSEVVLLEPR